MSLSISLLGSFQVMLDDQPATFATDSARALLAFLAVEAERPHRRETLAGLLWPEQPEQPARSNLSQTLVRLRRAIGDYQAQPPPLLITAKTIQFRAASADLDLVRFQTLLAASASHPHPDLASCPACLERLQQVVTLYRGPFLQGLFLANSQSFEEWRLFKQEQFHRQAMQALHSLAGSYELQGLYEPAQDYAKRQLALEPWREEAHRQLMRALALSGQRSAALAQYESCRRVLTKELAVEPAAETTALYEQIRAGILSRGAEEHPSSGTPKGGSRGENTPAYPLGQAKSKKPIGHTVQNLDWGEAPGVTAFYGREAELAQLEQWLTADRCRLVAILGMGGIGKTVLAARIVKRVSPQFDSVIWRSLLNAPPL
ncbi:MAG: winged helix-turn-helix domain-containing protein, partial [Chloroflexi bacterium]|nr:winged helix-turn-helix domain-containing protein [Chloroflexota bacterium]